MGYDDGISLMPTQRYKDPGEAVVYASFIIHNKDEHILDDLPNEKDLHFQYSIPVSKEPLSINPSLLVYEYKFKNIAIPEYSHT